MSKVTIWTYFYEPFRLGGSLWNPKGCEVEAGEAADLGGDWKGFEIPTPFGTTVVVESTSGAIVGATLDDVRKDIASGNPDVMARQVAEAVTEVTNMKTISPEEFWRGLQKAHEKRRAQA
jgi:hypothetical protein